MNVLKEYQPLYIDENFYQADCFGGRAGARSYSLTQHALYNLLYTPIFRSFFIREVHSTIYSSMWQDLKDRVSEYEELHGVSLSGVIEISDNKNGENYAKNKKTGASITTKGFKISSGNQTANLKSLAGATHLYIDECDETSEDAFRKLKLSFRKKGAQIKIVRAFNPPFAGHWIWKDYDLTKVTAASLRSMVYQASNLDPKIIEEQLARNNKTYYTAKIKPDKKNYICINTNFLNNYENLNPQLFEEFDTIFKDDFHYYCIHILGLIPNEEGDTVYNDFNLGDNFTEKTARPGDVLHIGMDFNITKMSAVVHIVEEKNKYAVEEFTNLFDTYQMCEAIRSRFPGYKVVVYPDASGQSRSTSGASDVDIIKSFGFSVRAPKKNGFVRDRINMVNSAFRNRTYFVNTFRCPDYTLALQKLKFKNGEPDKSSGFDHVVDAGGYFIVNQPRVISGSSNL
jgi:phage terminase large subunit